jgi:uncharacterized repeat protein (TIGR01451 family)
VTFRAIPRWLALLFGFLLLIGGLPARADTPISLYQSFRGNVNFTGTEESLRTKDNSKPCSLVKNGSISAYLGGIPKGATIESAQLYWAASGTRADYKVTFDGLAVSAPAARQYIAKANANNTTYTYFSGAADVTTQVKKKGNGYYSFSGLDVDNGNPWCSVQGVVGGFALVVVYSHPNEPFRMLNLYEGFQDFQNTSLSINLGDFNVPNPLPANVTGRVGHVTWEGDATLSQGGEDLLFNGVEMTDRINPKGNQFNSASNVTGDTTSYGIDFDIYTLTSPTIQPGQRTATTTYKSGQDLVILSAEIVAMPYVANADLALAMTRTGDLTVGSPTSYTLTVTNGGVDDEMGPVTVVDTLPAGLKLLSAGGTFWTCTNVLSNGQTVVTCTQPGPVKHGAKMTPLVIAVSPVKTGNYTNSATVSGKTGDDNSANNTATNSSAAVDYGSSAFVFTRERCNDGDDIVMPGEPGVCHKFMDPTVVAAGPDTQIYITAVGGVHKAAAMDRADYPLTIELMFSCLPYSGVPVSYAGKNTLKCDGSWQAVDIKFPAGKPSALLPDGKLLAPFFYADVGKVSMSMRYMNSVMDTIGFISVPTDLRFQDVFRADRVSDSMGSYGFVRAGEPFTMRVGALMANNAYAPSFGKEPAALKGVLPDTALNLDIKLDLFLLNAQVTPKAPVAGKDGVVSGALYYDQAFTLNPGVTGLGAMEARVRWYEAGSFAATPYLIDYLGTGPVSAPQPPEVLEDNPEKRVVNGTRVIGRFYPDHFVTTEVTPSFQCASTMGCPLESADPGKPTFPLAGAVYSRQPFRYVVTPYSLLHPDGEAKALSLFQNDRSRPVTLSAGKAPNDAAAPAMGALGAVTLPTSTGPDNFPSLEGFTTYSVGNPYNPKSRAVNDWGAPTAVYLRAEMTETVAVSVTAQQNQVITSRTPANTWTPQYEGGLMVVPGRLFLPNAFGSDLLRLPVPLTAQYWSGTAWLTSTEDSSSTVAKAIAPVSCRNAFAKDPKTGACKDNPLTIAGPAPLGLNKGKGALILQAPPRGTVGSVDYTLDNGDAKDWLPSTQARATFGLYRSPLIYLREVY